MKKIIRYIFIIGIIALFGWTIYFLYKKSEKPPEVYKTQKPVITTILKKTVATGSVVPRKEVLIKSQVSGIVEKIYVEAGKKINKGDVIARIKIIPDMVNLNEAESRLDRARINLDNAKIDYERNQKLFKEGIIAKTEFQPIELDYKSAVQELDAAQNNLDLIREGVTKKSGEATNTLIRSTISGMLLDVPVKEGNSVIQSNTFNDGTTIASIADMSQMIFEGKVDESEVGKIKEGMDLILTIGAIENETYKAKLEYISPKGVVENGAIQFQIKAAMNLKENSFVRAGYSANADIVLDKKENVLAVPEGLLKFEGDSTFVEVETAPQKFKKVHVTTGLSDGINIEVIKGVSVNDKLKGQLEQSNNEG
jgi:HlyD family secretion protein